MSAPPVLLRCDLGRRTGVGHLMRCVALAEELTARGRSVVVSADVAAVPFAREQVRARGLAAVPAAGTADEHARLVERLRPGLVVVDSYLLPAAAYDALGSTGAPVLAIVDRQVGDRPADAYLDQNLGAERAPHDLPAGARYLGGLSYALIRDEVVAARTREPRPPDGGPPRVVAFFGGTDPTGAAAVATRAMAGTGLPFRALVVTTADAGRRAVADVPLRPGQRVTAVPPSDRLFSLVRDADLVLSAAGTSTWELMCVGAAVGLVQVADNQRDGYLAATAHEAAVGLGHVHDLHRPPAALVRLLTDESLRAGLRERGRSLVDGHGRVRVADAVLPDPRLEETAHA